MQAGAAARNAASAVRMTSVRRRTRRRLCFRMFFTGTKNIRIMALRAISCGQIDICGSLWPQFARQPDDI